MGAGVSDRPLRKKTHIAWDSGPTTITKEKKTQIVTLDIAYQPILIKNTDNRDGLVGRGLGG